MLRCTLALVAHLIFPPSHGADIVRSPCYGIRVCDKNTTKVLLVGSLLMWSGIPLTVLP